LTCCRLWPAQVARPYDTRRGMPLWHESAWGPSGAPSAGFLQYLHKILEPNEPSPTSPTSSVSFTPAGFSTGHLHALAALLGHKGRNPAWTTHVGDIGARNRGMALQAWLYHLLGGEASGLETPESWRAGKSSKRLLSRVEVSVAAAAKECVRWRRLLGVGQELKQNSNAQTETSRLRRYVPNLKPGTFFSAHFKINLSRARARC